jgi:alpha-amylase
MKRIYTSLLFLAVTLVTMAQGWPNDYKGVMLQGFYWDSFEDTQWTTLTKQSADLSYSFDLIWIPQSGNCGSTSMGYDDLWWFNDYNSSFGNETQLRTMIKAFKLFGVGTIADVVINHRRNVSNWVDFPEEEYKGVKYQMVSTDIVANDDGGATKKWATENGYSLSSNNDSGEGWDGMRDLDHKSENVQTIVKAYLDFLLNDLGYAGFRYDMVKGYGAEYTKMYNQSAKPEFSVGECWDSSSTIKKWIDGTDKESAAFDFQFRYTIRNAINNGDWSKLAQKNEGSWPLVSNDFENGSYRQWAVTFVENHDTEKRSNAAQDPIKKDTLAANAYLLAMPGTPCVFLKHWQAYKPEIKAMIEARKLAEIGNTSTYTNIESQKKYYANTVDDKLLVVVGDEQQVTPDATQWTKILSGYHYAYYLANTLETAWADKGSGEFSEPFDVTLTAVSADPDAKLYYGVISVDTGDVLEEGKVESGTKISIDAKEEVVLSVCLSLSSGLTGAINRVFTYTEPEAEPVIPDFCQVNEGEVCAFFEAPEAWTNTIHCWAWSDKPSENFTGGTWPGVACEELGTAPNGNKVWKWTWDGKKQNNSSATQPQMIIFNNNGQPQQDDQVFKNGGYYIRKGLQGVVTPTAIRDIQTTKEGVVKVYSLDGRLLRTVKDSREATSGLPKGIYIINNRKFVLK